MFKMLMRAYLLVRDLRSNYVKREFLALAFLNTCKHNMFVLKPMKVLVEFITEMIDADAFVVIF